MNAVNFENFDRLFGCRLSGTHWRRKIHTHTRPQKPTQNRTKKYRLALGIMPKRWAVSLCNTENLRSRLFGAAGRDRSGVRALGSTWASWPAWPLAPQICPVLRFYMQGVKVYPKVQNAPQATPGALCAIACLALLFHQQHNARSGHPQAGVFTLYGLRGLPVVSQHSGQKKRPQASAQGRCGIHLYLFATLKSTINTNTGTARM